MKDLYVFPVDVEGENNQKQTLKCIEVDHTANVLQNELMSKMAGIMTMDMGDPEKIRSAVMECFRSTFYDFIKALNSANVEEPKPEQPAEQPEEPESEVPTPIKEEEKKVIPEEDGIVI